MKNTVLLPKALPYIVFNDLPISLKKLQKTHLFQSVDADFINKIGPEIQKVLSLYFKDVRLVESADIQFCLQSFVQQSQLPVLSMSPLLFGESVDNISFSRCCAPPSAEDNNIFRYIGRRPRYQDAPSYQDMLSVFKSQYAGQRVNIIDDIVFSGESMIGIIDAFTSCGIIVDTVCACVILDRAYQALSAYDIKIVYQNKYDSVTDVVCSRDFIFGIPDGGVNYLNNDGSISFCTYIEPFGDVRKWASIQDTHARHFSHQMLNLSYQFWTMMEQNNNRTYSLADLQKKPTFWPVGTDNIANGLLSIMAEFNSMDKVLHAEESP